MINWLIAEGARLDLVTRDGKKPIDVAKPSVVGILQAAMQGQAGQAKAPHAAVVFPLSRSGRRVFMAKRPNGQYMTFCGRRDHGETLWQTASREFREEGGDVSGGVLDLTGWTARMVEDQYGLTAYFIGRAPEGTTWKYNQKNKETTGGEWKSLDELKALHAAGRLRFGHHVLNIASQEMNCVGGSGGGNAMA
jgi:8-oxo-dGTP pyrophosphatase MutT (NUDIX family)